MKKLLIFLFILCIIAAIGAFGAYTWYQQALTASDSNNTAETEFEITTGESTDSILIRLEDAKLIRSKLATGLYIKSNDNLANFKAGKFTLKASMTTDEVLKTLNESPKEENTWVTIKEGLRFTKIVDALTADDVEVEFDKAALLAIIQKPDDHMDGFDADVKAFLSAHKPKGKSLEGFLFPDTYNVELEITEADMINLMVKTLITKMEPLMSDITAKKRKVYEVLTMASILEKEATNSQDYAMVAGIFYKRLELGMRFDSDATLLYGINKEGDDVIYQSEINDTKNLYNTRRHYGYTPTPIANPGVASLTAAVRPATTNNLFFLTGKDGKMYYAETYNQHLNNINRYMN